MNFYGDCEKMKFVLHCCRCNREFIFDDSFDGWEVECSGCGQRFTVEKPKEIEPPPPVQKTPPGKLEKYIARYKKEHNFTPEQSREKVLDKNPDKEKEERRLPVREYKPVRAEHPAPAVWESQAPSLSKELKDMSIFCLIMGVIGMFEGDD